MNNRTFKIGGLVAIVLILIMSLVSCRGCSITDRSSGSAAMNAAGETAAEQKEKDKKKDGMCTITIDNGAASANTDSAVNGLHVYDPDSKDLDDFVSGAEVPVGTKVSIYVYNLASPVNLVIEHNGKKIADKDYPVMQAWTDDDKVEFFDIVLEGDLKVTTKALEGSNDGNSYVSIRNDGLGMVFVGNEQLHDGNSVKNGTYDITIRRGSADVTATVKLGSNVIGTYDLTSSTPGYVLRNVNLNGRTLSVVFSRLGVPPAEYTVTLDNRVSGSDAVFTVGYADDSSGTPRAVNIVSGNVYEEGLLIGARALNNSTRRLRLSAYTSSGSLIDSVEIGARSGTEEGANGFYFELHSSVVVVLEYLDGGSPESSSTPEPAKPSVDPTPDPAAKQYTITINNGAASANTDETVNALHVYTGEQDDYTSGAKVKEGTKVTIFVYNYASPVHLVVEHNGKVIKDKVYDMIRPFEDDDKIELIDVTVQGDLKVTTEVAKTPVTPTEYTVTYEDKTDDELAELSLYWADDEENFGVIHSGDKIPAGKNIMSLVSNYSDSDVRLTAYADDREIASAVITTDDEMGGIESFELKQDVHFVLEKIEKEEKKYTVTLEDKTEDENVTTNLFWLDEDNNYGAVESGDEIVGGLNLMTQIINMSEDTVKVTAYAGTKKIAEGTVTPDDMFGGLDPIAMTQDIRIVVEKETAEKQYTITIDNDAASANTDDAVNGLHVYSPETEDLADYVTGDRAAAGTPIEIYVYNCASPVHLVVEHNGEVIKDVIYDVLIPYETDVEFIEFELEGDLKVTTEAVDAPEEPTAYTVTVEDNVKNENVVFTVGYIDMSSETPKQVLIESGSQYEEGLMIGARVMNDSDQSIVLTVYEGTEKNSVTIAAGEADGYYVESLKADTRFVIDTVAEPETKTHTVTIDDQVKEDTVVMNVRYVEMTDDGPKQTDIESGKVYEENTGIYVQIINSSDHKVKATVLVDGKETASAVIDEKPEDDDASYGGLMGDDYMGIPLSGDMKVILENVKADADEYTITIENGAASANTDDAVNAVHVYTGNEDDYVSGAKAKKGTPIELFVYNCASPVRLIIEHSGEIIKDAVYAVMTPWEDDDKIEFINFDLEGDLKVTTEVVETPEEPETYTVTVEDNVKNENVAFTVGYVDMSSETPKQVLIESGSQYEEGLMIGARVMNDSDQTVVLTVYEGTEKNSVTIAAGEADGYYVESLKADTRFVIETAEEPAAEKKTYSLKFTGNVVDKMTVYDGDEELDQKTADTISEGTHTITLYDENMEYDAALVTVTINGEIVIDEEEFGFLEKELKDLVIDGDVVIDVTLPEEEPALLTAAPAEIPVQEAAEEPETVPAEEPAAPAAEEVQPAEEPGVEEAPTEIQDETPAETPAEVPAESEEN